MSLINVKGVGKTIKGRPILQDINFSIEAGECIALIGPNGAGKTTLISIIAGLAHASSGRVSVMGHDVVKDYRRARASLGVVPQEQVFDPFFTVRETLRITAGYYGVRRADAWIDEVLEGLGLTDKAGSNMRALSGGMKRRVMVAQALIHRPPVIVLDEPTAGLDPDSSDAFCALLQSLHQELGLTVVMVTHDLDTLFALSSRVAVLAEQRVIIAAPVAEVLAFDHPFIRHFFLGERGLRAISDLPQLAHLAARLAHPAAPSSGA